MSSPCCNPSAPRTTAPIPTPAPSSLPIDLPLLPLPGGDFLMGTDYPNAFPDDGETPIRATFVAPFAIAPAPVTNAQFAAFIAATHYRTEAELFGWSFVFYAQLPPDRFAALVQDTVRDAPWWCQVPGATWSAPEGPGSTCHGREDHPVVHVSWNDAQAFCAWSQTRLPTEAEWEYAARGGLVQKLYPWGDDLHPNGEHRANLWQGDFPRHNSAEDGYAFTCPATAFPPNGYGLYSTTGNTWEWCDDWFARSETTHTTRVTKGGSFLCHVSYCNRYRVAARSSSTPDTSSSNTGFRVAR